MNRSFYLSRSKIDSLNFAFIDTKTNLLISRADQIWEERWRLAVPKFDFPCGDHAATLKTALQKVIMVKHYHTARMAGS